MATVAPPLPPVPGDSRGRLNCFTALRLVAAVLVIVGHSFVLTGHGPAPKLGGLPVHAVGVDVFFALSGFLITTSWTRDPVVHRYLARRALRILPALLCVVLLTMFVVGPTVTALSPGAYFRNATTWNYLLNLLLVGTYDLPGVFTHAHWTTAVNGCFWTLGLEFSCYALLAGARWLPRRDPLPLMLVLLAVGALGVAAFGTDKGLGAAARVGVYFAIGALIRLKASRRTINPLVGLSVATAWVALGAAAPALATTVAWIAVPVGAIGLGHAVLPRILHTAFERYDLSYGLYLWGFLAEQLAITRFGDITPICMAALVLGITLPVAALSWTHIEAPCLRLKPRQRPPCTSASPPALRFSPAQFSSA